jgi:hypothetical protein
MLYHYLFVNQEVRDGNPDPSVHESSSVETGENREKVSKPKPQAKERRKEPVLACTDCLKSYKNKVTLNRHIKATSESPLKCLSLVCGAGHSHNFIIDKFSSLEDVMAYCSTLPGKFYKKYNSVVNVSQTYICVNNAKKKEKTALSS